MRMGNLLSGAPRIHAASLVAILPFWGIRTSALVAKPSVGQSTSLSGKRSSTIATLSGSSWSHHGGRLRTFGLRRKITMASKWGIARRSAPRRPRKDQLLFGTQVIFPRIHYPRPIILKMSSDGRPISQTRQFILSSRRGTNPRPTS